MSETIADKVKKLTSLHEELGWLLKQLDHHKDSRDLRMAVEKVVKEMSEVVSGGTVH